MDIDFELNEELMEMAREFGCHLNDEELALTLEDAWAALILPTKLETVAHDTPTARLAGESEEKYERRLMVELDLRPEDLEDVLEELSRPSGL